MKKKYAALHHVLTFQHSLQEGRWGEGAGENKEKKANNCDRSSAVYDVVAVLN